MAALFIFLLLPWQSLGVGVTLYPRGRDDIYVQGKRKGHDLFKRPGDTLRCVIRNKAPSTSVFFPRQCHTARVSVTCIVRGLLSVKGYGTLLDAGPLNCGYRVLLKEGGGRQAPVVFP